MNWKLVHKDVQVNESGEISSKSAVIFEHDGTKIKLTNTQSSENHVLGSKKVLMDAAYRLEDLARQMKKKAESLK